MIPIGYMYKTVVKKPEWITSTDVSDVYCLTNHCSDDFMDYISLWRHNGYWLFDSPSTMQEIALNKMIDLDQATLFYYEAFEKQFEKYTKIWSPFSPEPSFHTEVEPPKLPCLEGYDVVGFYTGNSPECSPLSCYNIAAKVKTNQHCLFSTFEQAKSALEEDKFQSDNIVGPFRIIAVFTLG